MRIGETEISVFNAKQHRVSIDHMTIRNNSEWQSGSTLPYITGSQFDFKTITITLIVKGQDREEIIRNCSNIIALLKEPAELTLDGFSTKFEAILKSHAEEETVMNRWHTLRLTFEGYEYGTEVIATGKTSISIVNPGNIESPCIIEITPTAGLDVLTLTGICRDSFTGEDLPVTVENLTRNKKVVLDGLSGLITEDGALKDADMWRLPALQPGNNVITVDSSNVSIKVTVTPMYA